MGNRSNSTKISVTSLPDSNMNPGSTNTGTTTIQNNSNQETDNYTSSTRFSRNDLDLETMMDLLDPHLKPIPPLQNNTQSQQIFNEHKDLAQEYLMVNVSV
jgi:Leucine-rich repeat (LRR) protein